MDAEVPNQRLPKPRSAPVRAASMGYKTAGIVLLIVGGLEFNSSVSLSILGLFAMAIGCGEADRSNPEAVAHCGDSGRAMLYSALGLGITSVVMLGTGGVLLGWGRGTAPQQRQRRLRFLSRWHVDQPLWTSPAGGEQRRLPTSSGLALSLSF